LYGNAYGRPTDRGLRQRLQHAPTRRTEAPGATRPARCARLVHMVGPLRDLTGSPRVSIARTAVTGGKPGHLTRFGTAMGPRAGAGVEPRGPCALDGAPRRVRPLNVRGESRQPGNRQSTSVLSVKQGGNQGPPSRKGEQVRGRRRVGLIINAQAAIKRAAMSMRRLQGAGKVFGRHGRRVSRSRHHYHAGNYAVAGVWGG